MTQSIIFSLLLILMIGVPSAAAATEAQSVASSTHLADQLTQIRKKIDVIEKEWLGRLKTHRNAKVEVKTARQLMILQRRQKALVAQRIQELETTLSDLNGRKAQVGEKVLAHQSKVMKLMKALDYSHRQLSLAASVSGRDGGGSVSAWEREEAPRRRVMAHLVDHGLKEIEALRIDLSDLQELEGRILEEKQQIVYLAQDIQEQESVLALNQKLQEEVVKNEKVQSLGQFENYRKLKSSETQVEHLISEFTARAELENTVENEKRIAKVMNDGDFSKLMGKLPLPLVGGRVVSVFGRGYDQLTGLQIFKKGVEISGHKSQPVLAVSAGRVAFSGELPNYGRVMIVDQGSHFYTLYGHLGSTLKSPKDWVKAGDSIGLTDPKGLPIYFEIRSRNVAVNPLQWVAN